MPGWLVVLRLLLAFFVWAAHVLRKRGLNLTGPTASADRNRKGLWV
jgi:hypothetical protein